MSTEKTYYESDLGTLESIIINNHIKPEEFNTKSFKKILEEFIRIKHDEVETKDVFQPIPDEFADKDNPRGFVVLNDKFRNKVTQNVVRVDFRFLYPQIIKDWINKGTISFNYEKFPTVFNMFYDMYTDLTFTEELNENDAEIRKVLKSWLSYVYGLMNNKVIFCDVHNFREKVSTGPYEFLRALYERYKDWIVHIDTDTIFFISNGDIYRELEESDYEICSDEIVGLNFLGLAKKKYITFPNKVINEMNFRGTGIFN